jgi:hypothetical protein
MPLLYLLAGACLLGVGFFAGWKFRDSVAVTQGEMPIPIAPHNGSNVLEGWLGDENPDE